jgi:hypothetical protein
MRSSSLHIFDSALNIRVSIVLFNWIVVINLHNHLTFVSPVFSLAVPMDNMMESINMNWRLAIAKAYYKLANGNISYLNE